MAAQTLQWEIRVFENVWRKCHPFCYRFISSIALIPVGRCCAAPASSWLSMDPSQNCTLFVSLHSSWPGRNCGWVAYMAGSQGAVCRERENLPPEQESPSLSCSRQLLPCRLWHTAHRSATASIRQTLCSVRWLLCATLLRLGLCG